MKSSTVSRLHEIITWIDRNAIPHQEGQAEVMADLRVIADNLEGEYLRGYNQHKLEVLERSNLVTSRELTEAERDTILAALSTTEIKHLPPSKKRDAPEELSLEDLGL